MARPLPVLILAATEPELRDLRERAGAAGTIGDQPVEIAATGVGKASAAFAAGTLLAAKEYRALFNVGCAGAFPSSGLSVGDVVLADREIFADEGVATPDGFLDLEKLGLAVHAPAGAAPLFNRVPIAPPLRLAAREISALAAELGFRLRAGPLCTVSTGSGTDAAAAEIARRWSPLAESMEGAALALAALCRGVPFLEVRGISNMTGDRDRNRWDIPLACRRAAQASARILERAAAWFPPSGGRPQIS